MPKTIIPTPIKLFFIFLILAFLFAFPVRAWLDCPFDRINDPYPGQCARYIDTNNNQICDHSEPEPTKESILVKNQKEITKSGAVTYFLIITSVILVAYFLTQKFFSPLNFRLFWNLILLISFLPVGISGLLLFLNIKVPNYYFWHDQLGIVFLVVGFLHLIGRLNYFKQTLKNKIKTN